MKCTNDTIFNSDPIRHQPVGYARKGIPVLHLFLAESLYVQVLHAEDIGRSSGGKNNANILRIVSSIQGRHAGRS